MVSIANKIRETVEKDVNPRLVKEGKDIATLYIGKITDIINSINAREREDKIKYPAILMAYGISYTMENLGTNQAVADLSFLFINGSTSDKPFDKRLENIETNVKPIADLFITALNPNIIGSIRITEEPKCEQSFNEAARISGTPNLLTDIVDGLGIKFRLKVTESKC